MRQELKDEGDKTSDSYNYGTESDEGRRDNGNGFEDEEYISLLYDQAGSSCKKKEQHHTNEYSKGIVGKNVDLEQIRDEP